LPPAPDPLDPELLEEDPEPEPELAELAEDPELSLVEAELPESFKHDPATNSSNIVLAR
jgi:hypothetical protein